MTDTDRRRAFVEILVPAFRKFGIEAEFVAPTSVRIEVPEHEGFTSDFADAADQAADFPPEAHPELAEQLALGMMRQMRERGIAFGTHYPPRSDDQARYVVLRVFDERGINARFDFPDSLLLPLEDGRLMRTDPTDLLSSLEGLEEEDALDHARAFAAEAAADLAQHQPAGSTQGQLRVRLYADSALPDGALELLVARPFVDGVHEVVVLDFPDRIQPLPRNQLDGFGLTEQQAFTQAVAGSLEEPVQSDSMDALGTTVVHIGGEHTYTGAQLHDLGRHLGDAPHGALVLFPSPPVVMAHELGESDPVAAMRTLQQLGARFYADADKPITESVYWWRPATEEGAPPRLAQVAVEVDDNTGEVGLYTSDEDFATLLRTLMG